MTLGIIASILLAAGPGSQAGAPTDAASAPLAPRDTADGTSSPAAKETSDSTPPPANAEVLLDEIVVPVERPISKDATEDSTEIAGDRLRESTRTSTFQAVAQEDAGVYVPAGTVALHGVSNGATGGIRIRGLGGSPNTQVLVIEDGVPDYQGIFGHPIADSYIPTLIDQVLIVKGGDSTLYGTNALAGALVIRSRWRTSDGLELLADSAAGSYSTLREQGALLARSGRWDLAGGVLFLDTEGHRDGAGGSEAIGMGAVRYRFNLELSLTIWNKVAHLEGNDPGPVTHPTTDHWYDVWRDTASLQLSFSRGATRVAVTPYLNTGVHHLYDGFHSNDYVGGIIAEGETRLTSSLHLLGGLALEGVGGRVENQITGETPEVRSTWNYSVYGQATWQPLSQLTVVAGAREIASSTYGWIPLYKAGARWDFLPSAYVRAGVTKNFRQPTIRELYLPYPTANPDLKPERALNADVGVGFESRHLSVDVSGYRTEASQLIKYFGVFPAAEVVNIDRLVIWGTEATLSVNALGPFSAYASGDWQDVGRFTRQNPDGRVTFGLDATHAEGEDLVGISADGEWTHGLFMSDYGRDRIPDVFVVNMAARYRHSFTSRGLAIEPYLLARNVFDRQYAYVAGYIMPGFNVLLGLRLEV
ncbi:MAG TPA: TonB-dependent receptor [Gemmatimonadales bacterium]|nr:TonB-dependent receptor [Gemmatimonadales bacterium]